MVINEKLYYTYHSIDNEDMVIEVLTDTNLKKLQKFVKEAAEQTGYRYLYCGRKYHAVHWQQQNPEAADFLVQLRDAERVYQ